jgi:transposase InsO family protein
MSRMIDEHRESFGVEPICRLLQIAPSTYYAVKARQASPSARSVRDDQLAERIREVHEKNLGVYGARKVWWQLQREGHRVARCTVERLMAREGLKGAVRGKKRRTTLPDGQSTRAPDLVDRDFKAPAPNRLWVSDFTYVPAWSGTIYVAFTIDVFSRRIVGWKADTTMKTPLVLDTLEMALWARDHHGTPVQKGLISHSDAGSQGGLNWSSQHVDGGGADGQASWVDDGVDGQGAVEVSGGAVVASGCGAAVLA